jgi:hypothetical protein
MPYNSHKSKRLTCAESAFCEKMLCEACKRQQTLNGQLLPKQAINDLGNVVDEVGIRIESAAWLT